MGKIRSPRDATAAVGKTAARRGSGNEAARTEAILDFNDTARPLSGVGGDAPIFTAQADTDAELQGKTVDHRQRFTSSITSHLPHHGRRGWRR